MKHLCVLLLLFLAVNAPAQQLRKKTLVLNTAPGLHKDGQRIAIRSLWYMCPDSAGDACLLAGMDSVRWGLVYALSPSDSTRYNATIINGYAAGAKYIVTRFDSAGNYLRSTRYNHQLQADGYYVEYYPGLRPKVTGKYSAGQRSGKWLYFDKKGKAIRREKYRNGVLASSKDFHLPRRRFATLIGLKNYQPVPYEIIDAADSTPVTFASDTIPKTHAPVGMSASVSFLQRDFGAVRSHPSMNGLPRDYYFLFGTELHAGAREKFFVTAGLGLSIASKSRPQGNLQNVNAMVATFQYSLTGNVPVLKRSRSMLFASAGMRWAQTWVESSYVYPGGTSVVYFKNEKFSQPVATAGLIFEFSRKPNVPRWMTCLSLRAGYNYPVADIKRQVSTGSIDTPDVSNQGFYVGIGFTNWKVR